MTGCPNLPRRCGKLWPLLLVFLALAPVARAQDDRTQERLDRLERDLNMLQRQVYRDGPGGGAMNADPSVAVNTQIRLDRLEQEMRDLTGRVEDAVNQIQQLRQRIEQVNGDIAARFNEAAAQAGQGAAPPRRFAPEAVERPPRLPGGLPAETGPAIATTTGPGVLTPPGTVVPPPPVGLRPPGAPPAPSLASATPDVLPAGSATAQYNFAFGLLKQAAYPRAEQALKEFIRKHPRDTLAGNAQYWLGETYYARGRYTEAAASFAEGYKNYPKGAKAPDELLKLAMALDRAKQRRNACVALAQLEHDFPHPGAALKERAKAEKKRLGC
jgi:tol-pal system protein YbgF